jgi:hypothetical protein
MPRSFRWLGLLGLVWLVYLTARSDALYAPPIERDSSVGYAENSLAPDRLDYAKPLFVRADATICPSERVLEALTLVARLDTGAGYNRFVATEKCRYLPANLKVTVDARDDTYRRIRYRESVSATPQSGWLIWNELKN